jgi:hypothetical protein
MVDADVLEHAPRWGLGTLSKPDQDLMMLKRLGLTLAQEICADLDAYLQNELEREGTFEDFLRSRRTFPALYRAAGSGHSRSRLLAAAMASSHTRLAIKHFEDGDILGGWNILADAREDMGRFRPVDPKEEKRDAARFMASQRADRREEADCKRLVLEHWRQNQSLYLSKGKPSRNKAAEEMVKSLVPFPFTTVRNWLKNA